MLKNQPDFREIRGKMGKNVEKRGHSQTYLDKMGLAVKKYHETF